MLPRVNLIRTDETDYLMFSTSDIISITVYLSGEWAKTILDVSLMFCSDVPRPFTLDIGANLGAYAVPLAQKLADAGGTVFAYEPQRLVFYQLCGNVFLNRLENLHPFHLALGDREGTIDLPNIDYGKSSNIGGFGFSDCQNRQQSIALGEGSSLVNITRLDNVAFPGRPA
jgi:FkbM family methyltransferase